MTCCEGDDCIPRLFLMLCTPTFTRLAMLFAAVLALPHPVTAHGLAVELPAALSADGVPPVPVALADRIRPYLDYRSVRLIGWHPERRSMLISTRDDDSRQLYEVTTPGAPPRQISFGNEPIASASIAPAKGDVTLAIADVAGDEEYQLYRVENDAMTPLTYGGRNLGVRWTRDGMRIGYSSTKRTGLDTDLYMMDPRDPTTDRMVMAGLGGGWSFLDFSADGTRALLFNYISIAQSSLFEIDLTARTLRLLMPASAEPVSFGAARYGRGGRIYAVTDQKSEHRYLAEIDAETAKPYRLNPETGWDVEDFEITPDGRHIVYLVNEDGISRLRLIDLETRVLRPVPALPDGIITGLDVAPWGEIGFSITSAQSPGDAYAFNPDTQALTRWTFGNVVSGGDAGSGPWRNADPEIVTARGFDGLRISGLLYRPDPRRFPGPRPLLISFHGGPEGQTRPGYLGRSNYLVNELGIALFFPNVRGSTGYGKTFVARDNGPYRREDSVRDVGALLKVLRRDPAIDRTRMAVTGGSYGGYMTLAALIRYPSRFKAGLSIVGISNFVTFLEGTVGYRRDLRRIEYGDERNARQRRKLLSISPLTRAHRIRVPLLVVTGANDPRVPRGEADQLVAAVRANGGQAWHIIADDEGHGFTKKPNADYQFLATVLFWKRYLLEAGAQPSSQAVDSNGVPIHQ